MIKLIFGLTLSLFITGQVWAVTCTYAPDEKGFGFDFTAFAATDKSYVVSKNQFKDYKVASETGKLKGATIEIQSSTVDTSHDLNNGTGGSWPESLVPIRNMNVANSLFGNFVDPLIKAKILDIQDDKIMLEVDMNGVKRQVPMKFTVDDNGLLQADGALDILDFDGKSAFTKFEAVCTHAWHKGKSWTDVEIKFHVPVKKQCE